LVEKLENGKNYSIEEIKRKLTETDCNVKITVACVAQLNLGSAIAVRDLLDDYCHRAGGQLVFVTISSQPIYTVHWNDLSGEKQKQIERRKKN
jgi:hypothetical protein